MYCMVERCEAIGEKCSSIAKIRGGVIKVEFWYISGSYSSDEEFLVGNHMDAGDAWYSSDCCMHNFDICN